MKEQHKNNLKQLITSNRKIEAIKYIRKLTELGLKESKDLVDIFYDDISKLDYYKLGNKVEKIIPDTEFQNPELNDEEIRFVKSILKNGQKLNAVKYVMKKLNLGLKEAKEFVDTFEDGSKKTETIIFGENDSLIVEADVENETSIEFGAIEKHDSGTETDLNENIFKPRKKKKRKEAEHVTFRKFIERDKNKKRRRSNSGCMLMLTFMFLTAVIIAGGIYFL